MVHPRYRIVGEGEPLPTALTPVYPTTAGLAQADLRAHVLEALDAGRSTTRCRESAAPALGSGRLRRSVRLLHRPQTGAAIPTAGVAPPEVRRAARAAALDALRLPRRRSRGGAPVLQGRTGRCSRRSSSAAVHADTRRRRARMNEIAHDLREPHPDAAPAAGRRRQRQDRGRRARGLAGDRTAGRRR